MTRLRGILATLASVAILAGLLAFIAVTVFIARVRMGLIARRNWGKP